jgi:hypothetical protein
MPACCHACVLLRHWLIITSHNALVYRLLGRLDTGHEHTTAAAIRAYTHTTHSCTRRTVTR